MHVVVQALLEHAAAQVIGLAQRRLRRFLSPTGSRRTQTNGASLARRSLCAAGPTLRLDSKPQHARQGLVHRFRAGKGLQNFGLQNDDIAGLGKALEVFAAYAYAELLALQFRDVLISLARRCLFHTESPFAH